VIKPTIWILIVGSVEVTLPNKAKLIWIGRSLYPTYQN